MARLLMLKELRPEKGVPFSYAHIYRLIAAGQFPRPIKLSHHRIAFAEHEIDAWIEERAAARDRQAAADERDDGDDADGDDAGQLPMR